ncbi:hypothetical protein M569_05374, partial [Genlisea aurea]
SNPCDLEMEAGFQVEDDKGFPKFCTKLLELAATDDLSGIRHEVEEMGCDINQVGFWYARSFGSNKMGFEERNPLMIASLYGNTSVLKYIIESGKVDVNLACGSDGATALHCAAAGGSWSSLEVVKLLINASSDVNAVTVNGKRPGDLIAPCVKSCNSSKRKTLEILLNGVVTESDREEETPRGGNEKKEYPVDISLPDINNGIYVTDEFRMYSFKVKPCCRAYSHDWTECPFVHPGENARRRDLRKYNYSCVPCPEFKKGSCVKGDNCEYAHGVFESWLHPAQYRTRLCKDETGCARKVCFFAHKPEELRPLYASSGSGVASSPNSSCLEMSPSSPVGGGGGGLWQIAPPTLQLPGSRLKAAVSARDLDLDMEFLEKIRTQRQLVDVPGMEVSSPYGGGSYDSQLLSMLQQGLSPKFHVESPTAMQIRQQLRASYPTPSSPTARYGGFDSRSSSNFTKRSQSFIDRGHPPKLMASKLAEWSSPDGRLDWGFNGDDVNRLRKSASFGIRNGNGVASEEPDVSWVNSLVKDGGGGEGRPEWLEQTYMEQEQIV